MSIQLDGASLTIADVRDPSDVRLSQAAIDRMENSRRLIEDLAAGDDPIYAVNTGVGLLADERVSREDLDQLQRNVVRSHAAGVGEPLPRDVVRGMMLIRANTLALGFSGIRPLVAERLCQMLNRGVTPVVPSQ